MIKVKQIAKELLKIRAVFLSPNKPFTWASGIKSPIYCDNRMIISYPKIRELVENAMVENIKTHYKNVDAIVGTATAGIPHAAIIATKMNLPMAYVRAKAKDHGRNKNIEGELKKNSKVVVIEDLMSTARSSLEVVNILRQNKIKVQAIFSIFTYNMKLCNDNLKKAKVKNFSLVDLDTLLDVAVEEKYITKKQKDLILKFRKDPSDESWFKN